MKYWAFISYSHRDVAVAAALQRAIETYVVPRRFVGRATPVGKIPQHLRPVFRDRVDLQAGADLKATVREALAQSRYLVVVCSPDAVRSPWVHREIVEFKKLHGEGRVLALIASGEPFASGVAGREQEECFPEPLRFALLPDGTPRGEAREPLAADLRPEGDGRRLATLKLVAGILGGGIGVDELVRRDQQRRVRRLAAVSALSVVAMAVMAVLTVLALRARTEAREQQARAEDLIEFMLGDLRRKLVPVGRLDALDTVGEKALAYYAGMAPDRLDAGSLGRNARALHLIGEIHEKRGRLDDALSAFRRAAETTAHALALAPGDPQRIFEHGQSEFWVGVIARRRGELPVAEESFGRYRDLARRLVALDAGKAEWQLEAAYASHNLGVVQFERNALAEARASFTEARDTYSRMLRERPAVAFELADAQGWIAKVASAAGEFRQAIDAQRERLAVLRAMPGAESDRRARRNGANAHYELAELRLALGDTAGAHADAVRSVEEADALVEQDRTNLFWLSEACFNRIRLGGIEVTRGAMGAARSSLDRSTRDAVRLLASDVTALNWHVNLEGALKLLAARLAGPGSRPQVAEDLRRYLAKVAGFEREGKQLTAVQRLIVAEVEIVAGDFLAGQGRGASAGEAWQSAADRLLPVVANGNFPALTLQAQALLRLGRPDEARAIAARIESSNFRHPAYADLVDELAREAGPSRVRQAKGGMP